jgi:hypothetical protein
MSIPKEPFRAFPNIESILEADNEKKIRDPDELPIIDTPPEIADNIQINNSNNFTSEQVLLESTRLVIEEECILPGLVDSITEETPDFWRNKNNSIVHFDPNITIIKNDDDIIPNGIEENDEDNFFIKFLYEIYNNINSCYK